VATKGMQILVVLSSVLIVPTMVFGQATFGTGTSINDLPIDGGISLLVAAGVGYGAKKLYQNKKK
jgi:hypothetical protein